MFTDFELDAIKAAYTTDEILRKWFKSLLALLLVLIPAEKVE